MISTKRITTKEFFEWLKVGHQNLNDMSSIWSDERKGFVQVCTTKRQEQKLDGLTFEEASRMNKKSSIFEPILEIELNEENGLPEIRVGGKEIKYLRRVYFNWETKDETGVKQPTRFEIEYIDDDKEEIVSVQLNGGGKYEDK